MTVYNIGNMNTKFSPLANDDFLVEDLEELLKEDVLRNLIAKHKTEQLPRLEMLEAYYLNKNTDILTGKRRIQSYGEKSDHRAVHNYAKYVSRFIVGYLTGNPITIQHNDEKTNEEIIKLNDINDADAVNSDLALNLSIYGRAYEVVYRGFDDKDTFKVLDPKNTFVVYDMTLDKQIIAGVRYYIKLDEDKIPTEYVEVYTDNKIYHIKIKSDSFHYIQETDHFFRDVPIIEYLNDQFKQGDFENVISLIDLYDASQSDTANYMTDLNDAMLAIVGNVDLDSEDAKGFRDANMVHIQPSMNDNGSEGKADVKFIYKQYDVAGSEAYKSRLQKDIHKFTNTPDLNDESFGGVQSGESMKYKLFGLEQVRAIKERLFKKGLMKRYKLLFNNINLEGMKNHQYSDLTITFTPNLPKSMMESINAFNALQDGVSEETRLSLMNFIDNPKEELQKKKNEQLKERRIADARGYEDTFNKEIVDKDE
ncbi:phage portal protein [Mammaliicoccus lentus]|uniref:phage portal protein n=1 Tax=Mammaliicoccus lentus TaxID=42858 RepID=UPI001C4DEE79|nr:phage portal protein [Mammaliicoccus lentus]MBW0769174.1 phage portal protein [Mammaliicoccus lentus]